MAKVGRRTKRTQAMTAEVCKHIKDGAPIRIAAELAGLTNSSYHRWVSEGEAERDEALALDAEATPEPNSAWDFRDRVTRARWELHQELVGHLKAQSKGGDMRAATFLLQHKFREFYRDPAKRLEVTGAEGGPLQVRNDLLSMSPAQLRALAAGESSEEDED